MSIITGSSYRFKSYADNKYLNIYTDGNPSNNVNVTTYSLVNGDAGQVWNCYYHSNSSINGILLRNKKKCSFALDRWRGSSNTNNADVYEINWDNNADLKDMLVTFVRVSGEDNAYRIKLKYYDYYLTVSSSSVSGGMNVVWQAYSNTNSQKWMPELVNANIGEAVVTGMPDDTDYENDTEFFHPDAGRHDGTWTSNDGANIREKIKNYYYRAYGNYPSDDRQYMMGLWGGRYLSGTYKGKYHPGIDINKALGSDIYSTINGTVINIDERSGYQYYVAIKHRDYNYVVLYLHLEIDPDLKQDLKQNGTITVMAGVTKIGKESNRGPGNLPSHLHVEVQPYEEGKTYYSPKNPVISVDESMETVNPYNYI